MSWDAHVPDELRTPRARVPNDDYIRAIAVGTEYDGRWVLDGVDLAIRRGGVFVIMGPSGCGKTTMLRHLCGLTPPSVGSVFIDGQDVFGLDETELRALRLRSGLSFQGGALLGSSSIVDNVALEKSVTFVIRHVMDALRARSKSEADGTR